MVADIVDQIVEIIKQWAVDQRLVVLVGPPGCGKTHSVREASKRLGMNVVEIDSTEATEKTLRVLKMKPLKPSVYVVDSIESLPRYLLSKLPGEYPNPTFATTTDYVLASNLEGRCRVIKMFRPKAVELKKVAESTAKSLRTKVNYEALSSGDYRQATLSALGSQGYEYCSGRVKELTEMIKTGRYDDLDVKDLLTLLDSSPSNFYGWELIMFVKHLAVADLCKKWWIMNGFKVENPKVYPSYFLEKLKMVR